MKPILVAGLLVAATIAVGLAADDTQRVVVKKPFDVNVAKGPSKGGTPQILWHGGSVLNQVTQAQLCSKLYPMIEFIKSWSRDFGPFVQLISLPC